MPEARIVLIVGARPNLIKAAPLYRQLKANASGFEPILLHTGQHSGKAMSDNFFADLALPDPDINLQISGGSRARQIHLMRHRLKETLSDLSPRLVVVFGDVNSTAAGALAASELNLPLAHVEAGLRSFDRSMPEETNRIVADRLADYHFVSEPSGIENLQAEGKAGSGCHMVGNIMIDSLVAMREKIESSTIRQELKVEPERYLLLTLHRPENVDIAGKLLLLLETIKQLSQEIPVLFPCHPRTHKAICSFNMNRLFDQKNFRLLDPLSYVQFAHLESQAALVLTDSGGVQEETTFLGVPCLTLRRSTERPVTVEIGTNQLIGTDPAAIRKTARLVLSGQNKTGCIPDLWDGHTAERITLILKELI